MRGDAGNGDGDGDEDGDGDGDEEDAGMSRGCWRGWRVLTWPTVYMGEVAGEGGRLPVIKSRIQRSVNLVCSP